MQKKLGGSRAGIGDLELIKGIFHSMESHAQHINWGELPERVADLGTGRGVRHQSVGGERLHLCIICCFFFYCHYHYYYYLLPLLLYFILFSIIILLLSQHTSFTLNLIPIPPG